MLKDNTKRGKNLLLMLKISLFLNALWFVQCFWDYVIGSKYNFDPALYSWDWETPLPVNYNEPFFDLFTGLVGLTGFVVFIICAIMFILWFRRSYYNIEQAGISIDRSESTAAWAWFVPIYNLYAPYQIMKEVWEKTQTTYSQQTVSSNNLIVFWWIPWVVASLVDGQTDLIGGSVFGDNYELILIFSIISAIIMLVSNYFLIDLVKKISEFEQLMRSSVDSAASENLGY